MSKKKAAADTRKLYLFVDTGFVGATHEEWADLPVGWDRLSPAQQQRQLAEMALEFQSERCDCGARVVAKEGDE